MVTINNSASKDKLSLSTVKNCLFNEEPNRKEMCVDNDQTIFIEGRGWNKIRGLKEKQKGITDPRVREKLHTESVENQDISTSIATH